MRELVSNVREYVIESLRGSAAAQISAILSDIDYIHPNCCSLLAISKLQVAKYAKYIGHQYQAHEILQPDPRAPISCHTMVKHLPQSLKQLLTFRNPHPLPSPPLPHFRRVLTKTFLDAKSKKAETGWLVLAVHRFQDSYPPIL